MWINNNKLRESLTVRHAICRIFLNYQETDACYLGTCPLLSAASSMALPESHCPPVRPTVSLSDPLCVAANEGDNKMQPTPFFC